MGGTYCAVRTGSSPMKGPAWRGAAWLWSAFEAGIKPFGGVVLCGDTLDDTDEGSFWSSFAALLSSLSDW